MTCVLATLALAAGCAHGTPVPDGSAGWTVARTAHFVVYARTVPWETVYAMEAYHAAIARGFFTGLDVRPVEAVVFDEAPPFLSRCSQLRSYGVRAPTTAAAPGEAALLLLGRVIRDCNGMDRNGVPSSYLVARYLVEAGLPRAPLWLREGLATYLARASVYRDGDGWQACFGAERPPESVTLPVAEVLRAPWRDFNDGAWHENTAGALIDYLMHGRDGALRDRARPLFSALASGTPVETAWALAYPDEPLAAIDERLSAHLRPLGSDQRRPDCPLRLARPAPFVPAMPAGYDPPSRLQVPPAVMRDLFARLEKQSREPGHAHWLPPEFAPR